MNKISTKVMVAFDNKSEVEFSVDVCYNTIDEYGWTNGYVETQGNWVCRYEFSAKVYDTPSHYGINDGRISKLHVKDTTTDMEVIGYDHEWHRPPLFPEENAILNALLEIFDTPTK
jgi:hypothetical protein